MHINRHNAYVGDTIPQNVLTGWSALTRRIACMVKKNIDWKNLNFTYSKTDSRYVSQWRDGVWDEGEMIGDANVTLNESAGVLQYAQTCLKD